ncbi:hypothetical protein [Pseudoalteromonas sp. OOF1S-7]|uniref:hypothetical protein n=1 Tax=Pseudoalteromonas sp. OOF1S-7 TaxID=2917757 RepID=UPI001EF4D849|nr:hypothetical protein [Pseudoalteromonas sp. OOF1S-7]MCG7535981.1 hypothetical protein [Pseudoalteromonas sp. OOF1S-7]
MYKYFFLPVLLFSGAGFATDQVREIYIVGGKSYGIDVFPLESLYDYDGIQSKLGGRGWCSANWRGYKGTWELKGGELWLTSLVMDSCAQNPPLIDPVAFFGQETYPVKASWFNESIEVRLGDIAPTYCQTSEGEQLQTGFVYEATVYEFSAGDLVEQSSQSVSHVWQKQHRQCAGNTLWDLLNWIGI